MTRRLTVALTLWLLASLPAAAQMMPVGAFPQGGTGCGHGGYCGPGDIIVFDAWFSGTRGYSFAYSQPGTNKAVLLDKVIAGTTDTIISQCDVLIQPDGNADIYTTPNCDSGTTTVDQWGAHRLETTPTATGTGSASGTVLTITAMSSGDFRPDMQISGTIYITSYGTGTGGTGTYNLSGSLTLGSGTRTGTPPIIKVRELYDQTGNGWDATLVAGKNPSRYAWGGTTPGCVSSFPCLYQDVTTATDTWEYHSASDMSPASPMGLSTVGAQVAGNNIGVTCGGWLSSSSRQNAISLEAGDRSIVGLAVVSVSDSAVHAANASLDNTGTGLATLNVDGTTNTGTGSTIKVNLTAAPVRIFGRSGQDQMDLYQTGCKNGGTLFDSTILDRLWANDRGFYGLP